MAAQQSPDSSPPHQSAPSIQGNPSSNSQGKAWYTENVTKIPPEARELLEQYSKIPPQDVIPHVLNLVSLVFLTPVTNHLDFLYLSSRSVFGCNHLEHPLIHASPRSSATKHSPSALTRASANSASSTLPSPPTLPTPPSSLSSAPALLTSMRAAASPKSCATSSKPAFPRHSSTASTSSPVTSSTGTICFAIEIRCRRRL